MPRPPGPPLSTGGLRGARLQGWPASRQALTPPSSAMAPEKPKSRSVAAAIVEIFPSSQVTSTRTVGSGNTASTRSSI